MDTAALLAAAAASCEASKGSLTRVAGKGALMAGEAGTAEGAAMAMATFPAPAVLPGTDEPAEEGVECEASTATATTGGLQPPLPLAPDTPSVLGVGRDRADGLPLRLRVVGLLGTGDAVDVVVLAGDTARFGCCR